MEVETLEEMAQEWHQSRLKRSRALTALEERIMNEVILYLLAHPSPHLLLEEGVRETLTEFKDMSSFIRVATTPAEGVVDTGSTAILGESPLQIPLVELACALIVAASVSATRRKLSEEYLLPPQVVDYLADKFPEYPHAIGRAMQLTGDTVAHINAAYWLGASRCIALDETSLAVTLAEKIHPEAGKDVVLILPKLMQMRATLYTSSRGVPLEKSFPLNDGRLIDEADVWRLFFGETGAELCALESL
ncbi:hypothetical protein KBA73_00785 [Patescibacteria group bacterium]|nr:hypothetical protein [Patescibacteria group bacterium]